MARLPVVGQDGGAWGDVLNEYLLVSHNADGTMISGSSGGVAVLDYDTTGVADAGVELQALYDDGNYTIFIPPGLFKCNTPVFFDSEDGMAVTRLVADGVDFLPGTGLPTVSEFETFLHQPITSNGHEGHVLSVYQAHSPGGEFGDDGR